MTWAWPLLAIILADSIPAGPEPAPVAIPHFPRRLDAFVFRNWGVAPLDRVAAAIDAEPAQVAALARDLGLGEAPAVSDEARRRSALTVIRRNWHLLPYPQLLELLGWSEDQLGYALREDDFLWIKLGSLKPSCEPVRWEEPDPVTRARHNRIREVVRGVLGERDLRAFEPRFAFLDLLRAPPADAAPAVPRAPAGPRFLHSYFALYGDALLDPTLDPYPDGYLEQLARLGVSGVWLPVLFRNMAPAFEALGFPVAPKAAVERETRLASLAKLVDRAKRRGIGVYLYLNEPRALPAEVFAGREGLRGVTEAGASTLCTSAPEVKRFIADSAAHIAARVPDVAGFFTITASENLTSCWSHHRGGDCTRCRDRKPAEVVAEVSRLVLEGVRRAGSNARVIAWDWGWKDDWIEPAIEALPADVWLQSVSEWDLPIRRGGIETRVGEYSLSAVGPGPRAERTWKLARERGHKVIAKVQAGCTWELSAVPYVPAVRLAAEHAARIRAAGVDGVMLGWTLGGYPSPNVEVFCNLLEAPAGASRDPAVALRSVARRRFGEAIGDGVAAAWARMSDAFAEFPYHGGTVYTAPLQLGPANLLFAEPSGYRATMVAFPYDDLDAWRAVYPPEVFAGQLEAVARGFADALAAWKSPPPEHPHAAAVAAERRVAEAARLHFTSCAAQARFVIARRAYEGATARKDAAGARAALSTLARIALEEEGSARALLDVVRADSRIGFEASNQYYYVPADLLEKVVSCRWIEEEWIPKEESRWRL